jgi:hypothetical protein
VVSNLFENGRIPQRTVFFLIWTNLIGWISKFIRSHLELKQTEIRAFIPWNELITFFQHDNINALLHDKRIALLQDKSAVFYMTVTKHYLPWLRTFYWKRCTNRLEKFTRFNAKSYSISMFLVILGIKKLRNFISLILCLWEI